MAVVIDTLNSDPRKKDGAARHLEKAHRPDQEVVRKPDPESSTFFDTGVLLLWGWRAIRDRRR